MGLEDLIPPIIYPDPEAIFSRLQKPRCVGFFSAEQAKERGMVLVMGQAGAPEEGVALQMFWLVDETDGVIADAKFQGFGPPDLLVYADIAVELVIGKTYEQTKRIGIDLIEKGLQRKSKIPLLPERLSLVFEAVKSAAQACSDLLLPQTLSTPLPRDLSNSEGGYPGWRELTRPQKIAVIEQLLDEEIRPYIELDEGGIEVLDLINERELLIAYSGNCTSCFSSIGATLSTIQEILRTKIDSELTVVPNMDNLKFSFTQ